MNGRKARALRKAAKEKMYDKDGNYNRKADYRVLKNVEKNVYVPNPVTGETTLEKVKKQIIVNVNKFFYRKSKKENK